MKQGAEARKIYRCKYKEAYKAFKETREDIPLVKISMNDSNGDAEDEASKEIIEYSTQRLLLFLEPTKTIWRNILFVKQFRNAETAALDRSKLYHSYNTFKYLSYTIAEDKTDNLMNKKSKNRTMLSINDESIKGNKVLCEITEALKNVIKSEHILENLAFLFSPRNGVEQEPHLDYGYDPMNRLDLGRGFFHQRMSYSFVYGIDEGTLIHFLSPEGMHITTHLGPGDLVVWSGQQIHFGARYAKSNLRLFGNIRCRDVDPLENKFYWVN